MPTVRPETRSDIPAVRAVNQQAFEASAEADIVDALRRGCPDLLSLVVEADGAVVGHILFSPAVIEHDGRRIEGMGLAPMAVLPERQRQGLGSLLVEHGLAELRRRNCPFVIVLGHPDYYPRFGFEPALRHGLTCQWAGVPDEAFMVIVMEPERLVGVSGVARYRGEFDAAV